MSGISLSRQRRSGWATVSGCLVLAATLLLTAPPAQAAKPRYTNSTTLNRAQCPIYENFPKPGVPTRTWTKNRATPRGRPLKVGVRYTYKGFAMVLDYERDKHPVHWGFITKSCLTDPHARDAQGNPLPDGVGVGGNGKPKPVPMSAPHEGKRKYGPIHVGSRGTLRSGRNSFPIGNVRDGDPFYITRSRCGRHGGNAWVLGYAPNSGRWGYVQARHLPACH